MSIQSVSDYAAKSVEYLKESNNVVLFWVKYKPSYVSVDKRVVLRIRNPSRFGERMQGLTRENGALQEVNWETALKRLVFCNFWFLTLKELLVIELSLKSHFVFLFYVIIII